MMSENVKSPAHIVARSIKDAASLHHVGRKEIKSHTRRAHIVLARWDAWKRAHDQGVPLAEIGRLTGRHHTSILHGIREFEARQ